MLETLHFEEGVPILRQLPKPFTSAAFLLHPDLYLPSDDVTSPFLIPGLLDVFRSKGIKRCTYYEPVEEKGIFSLNQTAASDVCGLLRADMIIADEKRRAAFMSIYDSFTTLSWKIKTCHLSSAP